MDSLLFVKRVNALLAQKGIRKETFYNDCNITSSAFSQWSTGKTSPRQKTIEKISDYLGVSVGYLIREQKEIPVTNQGDGHDADFDEFTAAWDKATPQQRQAALAVLKLLVPSDGQQD